jgi:integral membrane sensor domain MASE1
MNIRNDIRLIDYKMHIWEHNTASFVEKVIHHDAFWPAVVLAIMLLGLIMLSHFAGNAPPPRMYEGPLGPLGPMY